MKTSLIISIALASTISLQASNTAEYNDQEQSVYMSAQEKGYSASKIKNSHLTDKENCNVAYGKLKLTSTQESNIDVFIKGFFNGCSNLHS